MSEISIRHLTKKFEVKGTVVTALNDVSLDVEKGQIYGIIGMSGAGKSTLVRSVNYLEKPTSRTRIWPRSAKLSSVPSAARSE